MTPQFTQTQHEFVPFEGGLDTMTPPLRIPPGYVRAAQNYEVSVNGGYSRIVGYERYDGQPKPSDAAYAILTATITGSYAVGNTLTGATSAATGVIIAATATYFVLTKVTGTFQAAEELQISAVTVATADSAQVTDGASTAKLHAQYKNLAADEYRDDIAAVPGSGAIRGVVRFGDVLYAFRDNAGATACALYKSTTSGWSAVSLGRELAFTSGGTTEIAEGDTITGATSGATAVITRVVLQSGSWSAGTAAGYLIFASQTGTFQSENLNVGAATNLATIAGNSSAITLSPGGRYEFVRANFGGTVNTRRIYGCDGVNLGFEFDGSVYVPIRTGMADDAPLHVAVHKNHLFFAFDASVQHSGTGFPYQWTVVTGAAELGQGDTVTGFMSMAGSTSGGALLITTRNRINVLYGNDSSDWTLVNYAEEAGALAYSLQQVGLTMMLDDRGVTSLQTSQAYGNFSHATLSRRIQEWVNEERTKIKASCLVRDKNQYRLFFTDKYALYVTMDGNKVRGMMPQLFVDTVDCIDSSEDSDGTEVIFFGSSDGMVYQAERGTSFDGDAIEYYMHLVWNPLKSPRQRKRFRHAMLEVSGDGYAEFNVRAELGYGTTDIDQPGNSAIVTSFSAGAWDAGTYEVGVWDGFTLTPSEFSLEGTAENISLIIQGSSDYFVEHTLSGAIIHYSLRRAIR